MDHQNCHGCKWLDRYKHNGEGYCCMVERSPEHKASPDLPDFGKVRRSYMPRCSLYEKGDWKTRYEK